MSSRAMEIVKRQENSTRKCYMARLTRYIYWCREQLETRTKHGVVVTYLTTY